MPAPASTDSERARPQSLRPDPRRVLVLTVVMATGAVLLWLQRVRDLSDTGSELSIPWWLIALAFTAAEVFVVHIEGRRGAHTYSLSEVPLVVGLFAVNPAGLVSARLVGSAVALVLHRRQSPVKLAFNLAMFALEACLVLFVFHQVLGSRAAEGPWAWGAAFAAMLAGTLLSTTSVSVAISLVGGRAQLRRFGEVLVTGLVLSALTNTSLALVTVVVLRQDRRAGALLLVVATIVFLAYRGYTSLRQRYARLELLYDFTRSAGKSLEVEPLVMTVLGEARELLRADRAELTVLEEDGARVQMTLGADGRLRRVDPPRLKPRGMRDRVVTSRKGLLAPAQTRDEAVREQLREEGIKDAMVAPLLLEAEIIGTLMVADRYGDVSTFDADDLRLFETLANHASITIANGRLVERLRVEAAEKEHQSRHDALTGLPNRTRFQEEVARAIDVVAGSGRAAAVVLLDLDDFKQVNDTLGHHNGDLLLRAVSDRLQANVRDTDTIARLGGDEFGLLLADLAAPADAERAAEKLLALLAQPFVLEGLTIEVGGSIGIAVHPAHGAEPATLLQRADVAMYAAKTLRSGFEVYAPEKDDYSPRRLTLAGELRSAMDNDDLVLHYQPKAELASGRLLGVEALLRWRHPQYGLVPPDEFIPIAERTGLIRPLTTYVLRRALDQCALWQAAGWRLTMAVNLSVRSLLDEHLADDVARLLDESGVPASLLTLEVTESSIMADSGRAMTALGELSALGVALSIDDFGTGHSSLGRLKRLPVSEVKIDKSFVSGMATDENDMVIVRSTVDLGHNLGLRVVAEGVEDEETWNLLHDLGCDVVQGYYLSRPFPAAELERCFAVREANHPAAGGTRRGHLVVLRNRNAG